MPSNSRRKWKCLDCGVDTGKIREHYFVRTDLWMSAVGSKVGMLCVSDLEKRIGRELVPSDFPDVHINNPLLYEMSDRLRSRL